MIMKIFNSLLRVFLFLVIASFSLNSLAQNKDLPNIVILATGGTIAGTAEGANQAGYTAGQLGIQAMITATPGIEDLANITGEQISNVGSQDMTIDIWLKLASKINNLLASDEVDGIVITHGTDTQEETAYFLSLVVKSDKPVVTTGAMRPATALSAEGPLNLYNAVAVAANPESKEHGVTVVMNDQIHAAHDVTKASTTSVQSFISPIEGQIGSVLYGKVEYFRKPYSIHTTKSEFSVEGIESLPRVDIIYAYADMPADLVQHSVNAGAKGIVIAGVGNGNMNAQTLEAVKEATNKGILVVRSTKVPLGDVLRNAEINDDEYRTVVSDELNPAKARVLAMLILLKERNLNEIQQLFFDY